MHRLLIRIYPESSNEGELDAIVEREIELPFVPTRGMRLEFAGDEQEDEATDVVLGEVIWRVPKNSFEFEMTERGENGGTVVAMLDEWTVVGFKVVGCSNARLWDDYRNGPPDSNGQHG